MSYPQYSRDWHQCHACGCTFPDRELRKLKLTDDVLKLVSDVYQCVEVARCARFKQHRQEALARELVGPPIGQHPQSRKAKP